jgi:hypothetical protein
MDRAAVAAAVVGQDPLDLDAVPLVVGDGATQESGSGGGFLVAEDLGIGEAAVIVDRDVDVLPADGVAVDAGCVPLAGVVVLLGPVRQRLPAPPAIRPSFLTSRWTSSPGREYS